MILLPPTSTRTDPLLPYTTLFRSTNLASRPAPRYRRRQNMTTTITKPRRSQADRSAATRAKVLAAARDVLCAQGNSGATLHAIRDAAGMRLGAQHHQFPTKTNLENGRGAGRESGWQSAEMAGAAVPRTNKQRKIIA